ncbi:MAG: hypothetical protein VX951_14560, partial [Planctomycetota bacterium]|nr:hypothetical protein [Planctomycetota bacterium]
NHGDTKVKTEVVLDETVFSTPIDLNGDGDCDDTNLLPSECTAAFLRTTVTFRDGVTRTFLNMIPRRREVRKTVAAATRQKLAKHASTTPLSTARARAIKAAIDARSATSAQIAAYKAWLTRRGHSVTTDAGTLTSVAVAPVTKGPRTVKSPRTKRLKLRTAGESRQMVRATRVKTSGSSIKSTWEADQSRVVVAMQVDSRKQLFVGRLKVNGVRVFSNPYRAAPTGTLFKVSPFKLEAGHNRLDDLLLLRSNYGGRINTRGVPVSVTLYFESGGKARFKLGRS